jgi:hypothetical protein
LRAGMDLPFACKGGMCSTCRAAGRGEAQIGELFAGAGELKAGFILTCQARPTSDKVVVDYALWLTSRHSGARAGGIHTIGAWIPGRPRRIPE